VPERDVTVSEGRDGGRQVPQGPGDPDVVAGDTDGHPAGVTEVGAGGLGAGVVVGVAGLERTGQLGLGGSQAGLGPVELHVGRTEFPVGQPVGVDGEDVVDRGVDPVGDRRCDPGVHRTAT
jgi:hypothetical protein